MAWEKRRGASLVAHPASTRLRSTEQRGGRQNYREEGCGHLKARDARNLVENHRMFSADADWEAQWTAPCSASSSIREKSVSAGSRILVEKKIYSKFVEAMTEKAKRHQAGPPDERETKMAHRQQRTI